ncbi:MAG: HlyD family efflux transporter periplasmic adaptor subunit [Corynebacterium sp.]|nr:HlyD family efflux transporter periplasmic adaptor subunit [Corynebacterium sp.]
MTSEPNEPTQKNDFAKGAVTLASVSKKPSKAKIIVPILVLIAVILMVLFTFVLPGRGSSDVITSSDISTVEKGDISQTVSLSGTVEAKQTATLTTPFNAKATAVNVSTGSRVTSGDVLVSLDVSDTQRDLASRESSLDASRRSNLLAAQQAQQALDQANSGVNSDVRSAESGLRGVLNNYEDAKLELERQLRRQSAGLDSTADALNTLNATRASVILASLDALNSGFSNLDSIRGIVTGTIDSSTLSGATTVGTSVWRVSEAQKAADRAQSAFDQATIDADEDIQKQKRNVESAYQSVLDAQFNLEQAKISAQNNRDNLQLQADNAWAKVNDNSDEASLDSIRLQIADKDIKAPFDGIVTSLNASVDNPVSGQVATIADDSTLIVKGKLKEADFAKVKEGAEVTFTSVVAPDKTFTGKVTKISNVPEMATTTATSSGVSSLLSGSGSASTDTRAEYPIEVEVTGDREGLNLGASAKLRIVSESASDTLTVPNSAIMDDPDDSNVHFVYVINSDDVLERRNITTGFTNGVSTAVTDGDLNEGDRVISYPSTYAHLLDRPVKVSD